jgi:hypothetical protein
MNVFVWSNAIAGALLFGYVVVGLFFFRFWRKTRDRLFLIFGCAFWMLMFERFILLVTDPANEIRPYIYTVRLIAFLLILLAIIDKNRSQKP